MNYFLKIFHRFYMENLCYLKEKNDNYYNISCLFLQNLYKLILLVFLFIHFAFFQENHPVMIESEIWRLEIKILNWKH